MRNLKISIVTVCYNAVDDVESTILSVLEQTYTNIEYILIDGASTDGTIEVIKKYNQGIAKWVSEPDNGIYDAMNKGISLATGDFIQFLNAGDVLNGKTVCEEWANQMIDNTALVYYGDMIMLCQEGRYYGRPGDLFSFNRSFPLFHPSTLVHRELIKQKMFDTKYRISADYKLLRDLYLSGVVFHYVPIALVQFDGIKGVSSNYPYTIFMERGHIWGIDKGIKWQMRCFFFKNSIKAKFILKKVVPPALRKVMHERNMIMSGMAKMEE